jgi:hypothetical protein
MGWRCGEGKASKCFRELERWGRGAQEDCGQEESRGQNRAWLSWASAQMQTVDTKRGDKAGGIMGTKDPLLRHEITEPLTLSQG